MNTKTNIAEKIIPITEEIATDSSANADPLAFLNSIGETSDGKKQGAYPQFPDLTGEAKELTERILQLADAEDQLKLAKKSLGELVTPFYFEHWRGKTDPASSIRVAGASKAALVTFSARLKKLKELKELDPVKPLLKGKESEFFAAGWELTIDGDEIPRHAAPQLVAELAALFAKYQCPKALKKERSVRVASVFHSQRHRLLTPEENMAFNAAIPIVVSIKTKGIK